MAGCGFEKSIFARSPSYSRMILLAVERGSAASIFLCLAAPFVANYLRSGLVSPDKTVCIVLSGR